MTTNWWRWMFPVAPLWPICIAFPINSQRWMFLNSPVWNGFIVTTTNWRRWIFLDAPLWLSWIAGATNWRRWMFPVTPLWHICLATSTNWRHWIPSYAIAVGNPAKVIKYRFDDETISLLLKARWWDLSRDVIRQNITLFKQQMSKVIAEELLSLSKGE